jgi:hypothetical protein
MAGGKRGCGKWMAIILIAGMPASAMDRARLDRCQAQLGVCYDACKSSGTAPKVCDRKCTTGRCGLPWTESYGSFLDRRIEENAARTGLSHLGVSELHQQFCKEGVVPTGLFELSFHGTL